MGAAAVAAWWDREIAVLRSQLMLEWWQDERRQLAQEALLRLLRAFSERQWPWQRPAALYNLQTYYRSS